DYIEGLSRLAGSYHDIVNELGNESKIFIQIGHSGCQIAHWGWQGQTISSSQNYYSLGKKTAKALTIKEISEIIEAFSEAAYRSKKAGFDGVQLHGAHGYLITQFYSPFFNKRTDIYGGSIENRARFTLKIFKSIRKKVGNNYPVCIKMNGSDRIENGLKVSEAAQLACIFAKAGFNALEISSYIHEAGRLEKIASLPPESQKFVRKRGLEAFNLDIAKTIKKELIEKGLSKIPIILVGGLYRFENIKNIVENNSIDFCALSRPLIRQPNLPNLWKKGPLFQEAECTHCNLCTQDFLVKGPKCKGVRCILKEKEMRKRKRKAK
ncbi:MAG: NADH:flavin oxidoreductase, partial [Promethearchaeota archaeon]